MVHPLSTIGWQKTGKHSWRRPLNGLESFMYTQAARGVPKYSIFPSVLVKLEEPIDQKTLSQHLRIGWQSTLLEIPNITVRFCEDDDGAIQAIYSQSTTKEEVEDWMKVSFHDYACFEKDTEPMQFIADRVTDRTGVPFELDSPIRFCLAAYYFFKGQDDDRVTHLGLIGSSQHTIFDGSGVYLCLNHFLRSTVNPASVSKLKPAPEPDFREYIPIDIRNSDLMPTGMQQVKMLKAATLSHCMKKPGSSKMQDVRMKAVRHYFSPQETRVLIQEAKKRHTTISQVAHLCHYIPLLKRFPAESTASISYATAVNLRASAGVPPPHYANAGTSLVEQLSCSDLGENICQGKTLSREDALNICQLSSILSANFNQRRPDLLKEGLTEMAVLERLIGLMAASGNSGQTTEPAHISVCVSDGILERHIQRHYHGPHLGLQVLKVGLQTIEPEGDVHGRTSTFNDSLCLAYQFNDSLAWDRKEVQVMVEEWAAALQYVLSD